MQEVIHGISSQIKILRGVEKLFSGLPLSIEVGHYHSWVVSTTNFPDCLEITSVDAEKRIMSLRHKSHDVCGIQFHPESILTPFGKEILRNWLL
jgi:anthranilate synthase component 2